MTEGERKRLWEEFCNVNPDDRGDVLRFCRPRNFMLMRENPIIYVLVGEPGYEDWTFQEFRRWHQDFSKNVVPATREMQSLFDKPRLSEQQRDRLRVLINFLSAKSYRYCASISPMLPPVSQNEWPPKRNICLQYVPAYPGIIGGAYCDVLIPDPGEIDAMTYENAEGASYLADLHTSEEARDYQWAQTVTTVGHVFIDLIEGGPVLKCAECGYEFRGNAHQQRHIREGNDVRCPKCSGIEEGPKVYRRKLMQWRRKRKRRSDHEKTSGTR